MRGIASRRRHLYSRVPADTVPRPTVTSVSPTYGPSDGGTAITITGTGFQYPVGDPKYEATGARIDGVACTSFVVVSDTQITCVTPAHAPGPCEVEVQGPGGSAINAPSHGGLIDTTGFIYN